MGFTSPTLESIELRYFSNNTLSGTIPSNFFDAINLMDLWLDGNDLTGTIPDVPENRLLKITEVLLNNNRLSGPVPSGFCDLRASFPSQFVSLHADCEPPPQSDVPQNFCTPGCCTDCSVGKGVNTP